MNISLSKAASVMAGELIGADEQFSSTSTDTRTLAAGDLFFALRGENFNGEVFVERAFQAGACAAVLTQHQPDLGGAQIIVQDATQAYGALAQFYRQNLSAKVIGITGSCGKTSVKGMLASILNQVAKTQATAANFNNYIGVPLTLLACADDTEYLVVEAGTSYPGEISYLTKLIDPDIAVVINVHPAHIQGFGSLEAIAEEKSAIYSSGERSATLIVNAGLMKYQVIKQKAKSARGRVIGFDATGLNSEGSFESLVSAGNITLNEFGCAEFTLLLNGKSEQIVLSAQGKHQVENALAAASCAIALDIDMRSIVEGLKLYQGDKGRMQRFSLEKGVLIDDSYNANPASMRAAIDLLSSKQYSILVLGDMGELGTDAENMHRSVGEYARSKGIKEFVCIGHFADDYCDGYGAGSKKFTTHDEVVAYLYEQITEEKTVLVKGSRIANMDKVCRGLISLGGEQ